MQLTTVKLVEKYFQIELSPDQKALVNRYLKLGERPEPDGCMGCNASYIRILTGQIDAVNMLDDE